MLYLNKIQQSYHISPILFNEMKMYLSRDVASSQQGLDTFIHNLPEHLKTAINLSMHYPMFLKMPIFSRLNTRNKFLGWIASRFKCWYSASGTFVYE